MANWTTDSVRRAGVACIAGATATAVGAAVVQGIVQPASTISDERWSYPWSSGALVPISGLWASLHVLIFIGVLGFARSRVAGTSRSAGIGAPCRTELRRLRSSSRRTVV
jgi:hypothetical protein